jgi:Cysteine-rich CPCC
MAGGANECSLIDGQHNFCEFGACEVRIKDHVRAPMDSEQRDPAWRPLQPERDHYSKWDSQEDQHKWQAIKDPGIRSLYYWLPEYWLA